MMLREWSEIERERERFSIGASQGVLESCERAATVSDLDLNVCRH